MLRHVDNARQPNHMVDPSPKPEPRPRQAHRPKPRPEAPNQKGTARLRMERFRARVAISVNVLARLLIVTKVSCAGGYKFSRETKGELDGLHDGGPVDISMGKYEAGIKGSAGKDGLSGSIYAKGTAAEVTFSQSGNGAESSATGTSMMAEAKIEGKFGTGGVGASACAEGEIVKGTVKGSVPMPYTGYNVTAEGSAGAGGAFCGEAKVGKDGVKLGTTLGLGPVLGVSIGAEPTKKD